MTEVTLGSKAPGFDLPRDGGGRVSLQQFEGRAVVLFFYPKDDTSGCTTESLAFTALQADFDAAGATIIGMSPDSVKSHDKFTKKHALGVILASDENKAVLEAYGVWKEKSMYGRKYMGVERTTFLIDAAGKIARIWDKVKVAGHAEDVLQAVKGLLIDVRNAFMTETTELTSLRGGAIAAILSRDVDRKTRLAQQVANRWFARTLSLRSPLDPPLPERPGRPDKPELMPPKNVEKRSLHTPRGRIALLHSIAHIELNAVDLALDIVARFATEKVPNSFFDGWMQVAFEEAKHFRLIRQRLQDLGADYGDMPAHDGLWQAAHATRGDLTARLAVVPLILEARGLDVTPALQAKMRETGDLESAAILDIIYNDEKGHVAVGAKWFRFLCSRERRDPAATFQQLVRSNFRGALKAPFNDVARAEAGLTPSFYRSLTSTSRS